MNCRKDNEMSSFDAVEFLVLKMFPAKLVNFARAEMGGGKSRQDAVVYVEKVEFYERALRALSEESLMAMVEDERQQDAALQQEREERLDRHRFFNDPNASADLSGWTKHPCWTLDEATALILGKNPEVVNWDNIEPLVGVSPFAERFAAIRRHLSHALANGQLFNPVSPDYFLAWAHERGVVLPEALEGRIVDQGNHITDNAKPGEEADEGNAGGGAETDRAGVPQHASRSGRRGETLSDTVICFTREQSRLRAMAARMKTVDKEPAEIEEEPGGQGSDGLLKMMIAMAIGRYGFDPASGRNSTVTDIVRDLEKVGLSLSPATLRKWLREASALLPDRVEADEKAQRG